MTTMFDMDSDTESFSSACTETLCARYAKQAEVRKAREGVRTEIEALIQPYKTEARKPPFSTAELVVMVILCSDEHFLNRADILSLILKTFMYYRDVLINSYSSFAQAHGTSLDRMPAVVPRFDEAFGLYDVPLRVTFDGYYDSDDSDDEEYPLVLGAAELEYTVQACAGRVFLNKWLDARRKGTFPSLKLPAELRIDIYELLFRYPDSGFHISSIPRRGLFREPNQVAVRLCERIDGQAAHRFHWQTAQAAKADVRVGPMNNLLALLSTCKQIYAEAMPYFYRTNTFHFDRCFALHEFLPSMPAERMQHLRVLKLTGLASEVESFRPGMKALEGVQALKRLEVTFHDADWLQMSYIEQRKLTRSKKDFTAIEQVPGFKSLAIAASRAEKVVFHGECPLVKAYVETEAARLKMRLKSGISATKKRRKNAKAAPKSADRVGDSDAEEGGPTKKKQKKSSQADEAAALR